MKRVLKLLVLAAFLVEIGLFSRQAVAADAASPEKTKMKLLLKTGDSYKMRIAVEEVLSYTPSSTSGRAPAAPPDRNYSLILTAKFDIRDVDRAGDALISLAITSVEYKQNGQEDIKWSSFTAYNFIPRTKDVLQSIVNQPLTMTLTSDGGISRLAGVNANLEGAKNQVKIPDVATPDNRPIYQSNLDAAFSFLKTQFGDGALRNALQQIFPVFSNNEVAIGDAWEKKHVVPALFPTDMDARDIAVILTNSWKLKSRQENSILLDVTSKIEPDPDQKNISSGMITGHVSNMPGPRGPTQWFVGGVSYKYVINGSLDGNVELDKASGWPIRGKINQKLNAQVQVEPQNAGGGRMGTNAPGIDVKDRAPQSFTCKRTVTYEKM